MFSLFAKQNKPLVKAGVAVGVIAKLMRVIAGFVVLGFLIWGGYVLVTQSWQKGLLIIVATAVGAWLVRIVSALLYLVCFSAVTASLKDIDRPPSQNDN